MHKGWTRLRARRSMLALAAALTLLAVGATSAHAAQVGAPTDQLQVWNLNTHGMDTGTATNYRKFIGYITDPAKVAYYPDIVTLQEAGTQPLPDIPNGLASCNQFVTDLEAATGVDYYCVETTFRGGAAIVYRTARLSRQSTSGSNVNLKVRDSAGNCYNKSNPGPGDWWAKTLRLKDDANPTKYINVGSVHLDTNGNDCAWENMKLMDPALGGLGSASMQIMAGDWNHVDATASNSNNTFGAWECWYLGTNADLSTCGTTTGNLGWKDSMYRACLGAGTTDAARYNNCLHPNHWSFGSSVRDRRDFLFAKTYAIYNQITVPWESAYGYAGGATQQYSDHRGQGALLKYY
jgi:hypothetical protein